MEYKVIKHASIKIKSNDKVIYFDPYEIDDEKADYIFITHDHFDHYDKKTINKLKSDNTKFIVPKILKEEINNVTNNYLIVEPNKTYQIDEFIFDTISSYNISKPYHPKDKEYVGYIIKVENKKLYIMGDTDRTSEIDNINADICFVPIGGTYTMNVEEASNYINDLKPSIAIPIHYGSVVGSEELAIDFKNKINNEIKVEIQM